MPQISVEYSPGLAGSLDRRELGREINRLAVKTIAATPEGCKTVFRPVDAEFVVGEDEAPASQVLVEFRIFPGRTPEAKAALSEAVLALLAERVAPVPGERLHLAVDIRDIDRESYRSTALGG
ncbi:5-carboxymethyl-2-hydroxymuconate Delta-isomerase [Kitasatospora sp. NPDC004240]